MRQTRVRPMVESAILSSVSIVLALIGVIFPLIILIEPLPIIIIGIRNGHKWTIMATVVSSIIIAMLISPFQGLKEMVGPGLIGIVIGYAFRMNFSMAKTIMWGIVVSLVSVVAVLTINFAIMGVNPFILPSDFDEKIDSAIERSIAEQRNNGAEEQQLDKMKQVMYSFVDLVKVIAPGGVIMGSVITVILQILIAKKILRRLGYNIDDLPPLKYWNLPNYIVYFFIISLLMRYWGESRDIVKLYNVGINLQSMTSFFLVVQGTALFRYFADKYKLSGMHQGIILVLTFFSNLLIIAGAVDMILDYRRLRPERKSE